MPAGFVLAFDFGLRHIGVAVGQTVTGTAAPLTTLAARMGRPDWQAVTALVNEWRPGVLLVGLPLNMDDTESEMSGRARRFATALGEHTHLPVHLVDERLTSRASRDAGPERARDTTARRTGNASRASRGHRPMARSHEYAAALIAETWFQEQPRHG